MGFDKISTSIADGGTDFFDLPLVGNRLKGADLGFITIDADPCLGWLAILDTRTEGRPFFFKLGRPDVIFREVDELLIPSVSWTGDLPIPENISCVLRGFVANFTGSSVIAEVRAVTE